MYPADHPIWRIARLAVLSITLCLTLGICLAFNYKNGWATNDLVTLLAALASAVAVVGGFDAAKASLTAYVSPSTTPTGSPPDASTVTPVVAVAAVIPASPTAPITHAKPHAKPRRSHED